MCVARLVVRFANSFCLNNSNSTLGWIPAKHNIYFQGENKLIPREACLSLTTSSPTISWD